MLQQLSTRVLTLLFRVQIIFLRRFPHIAFIAIALYTGFVFLYRLDRWPVPWFDEGSYLKVAKNYALNGIYADYSSEGNIYTGAIVAVGPTVLLPSAFVFKVAGINILYARLTIVGYSIAALYVLWLLCGLLWNKIVAVTAVVGLLLTQPFIQYGRQIMGEVPGLFFVLLGLTIWAKAHRNDWGRLIIAGVIFGLACITKSQYAIIVLPALFISVILDIFWYRQGKWLNFVVPGIIACIMYAAWTLYIFFVMDSTARNIPAEQALLRMTTADAFGVVSLSRNFDHVLKIGTRDMGVFLVPTMLYQLLSCLRRNAHSQSRGLLLLMLCAALGLYIFSNGWARYSFPVLGLLIPGLADMLVEIMKQLLTVLRDWRTILTKKEMSSAVLTGIVVTGLLVVGVVSPLRQLQLTIVTNNSDDVYRLAKYLNTKAKADALIETWEQEIAVLTNHTYHFPPTKVMVDYNAAPQKAMEYDFRNYVNPDYVIVGPFARDKAVYMPVRLVDFELVETIGVYKVYKKQPGHAP